MQVFRDSTEGGDGSRSVTLQAHRAVSGRCKGLWGNACLVLQPQLQSAAQNMEIRLCLSLHYSIAIPGNMAKQMALLLWIDRQFNSI